LMPPSQHRHPYPACWHGCLGVLRQEHPGVWRLIQDTVLS
jgi:hypothetical protein